MKLLIDIPKKDYDKMCKGELIDTILVALKNGKSIPDNATNGDILKMMFPSDANELDMSKLHLMYDGLDYIHEFRKDWWNSPYKKEVEE